VLVQTGTVYVVFVRPSPLPVLHSTSFAVHSLLRLVLPLPSITYRYLSTAQVVQFFSIFSPVHISLPDFEISYNFIQDSY